MMPAVATPRIPKPTRTATTIRTTLRALLPPFGAAAGVAVEDKAEAEAPGTTVAPHLLQNFVPGLRVAPHELQNAISDLAYRCAKNQRREYTAEVGRPR